MGMAGAEEDNVGFDGLGRLHRCTLARVVRVGASGVNATVPGGSHFRETCHGAVMAIDLTPDPKGDRRRAMLQFDDDTHTVLTAWPCGLFVPGCGVVLRGLTMIEYLYSFSALGVAVLFTGVMLGFSLAAPFVGRWLGFNASSKEKADIIGRSQSSVLSFCALTLAFSLVQVQGNFRQTEQIVHKEASTVLLLEHQLIRLGSPGADSPRTLLRAYADSIIQDDWPAMRHEELSDQATAAFRLLSDAISVLQPTPGRQQVAYADTVKSLDSLFETCGLRRAAATIKLSFPFWCLALVLLTTVVGLNLMVVPLPTNLASAVIPCVVLSLLAAVVFITDRPFLGHTSIPPTSMERVLIEMNTPR